MSIGLGRPQKNHEQVQSALEATVAAAKKANKHVMYNPGLAAEEISRCVAMGVDMLELSNDLSAVKSTLGKAALMVEEAASGASSG